MYMRNLVILFFAMALLASCKPSTGKLPSGYEYIMHTKGTEEKVQAGDVVYFQYSMSNEDSVVVSSYSAPEAPSLTVPDAQMLAGQPNPIVEALMLMGKGDSLTIIVPLDTVPQKPMGFENEKFLYYSVSIKDVRKKKDLDAAVAKVEAGVKADLEAYKKGTIKDLKTTASGLKYIIHEQGKGKVPTAGNVVSVDYYGALVSDGKMFDSSFSRGSAYTLQIGVGQVIPGWDEGIMLLPEGTKATIFIPANLGYGEQGSPPVIPANADLVFYLDLKKVTEAPASPMPMQ